ncbi:unnamed protein product [Fraxinus pennsylvanica]|uniref:Serine/threonine-protein phosphatase 2A 55 kDa regulatory subunit B n=1 Tax=Fraxinus pennsylvanica TaxID=56036 RepID=A0AAD2DJL7_9LAMI|nr:unnamed protein product [Fraxinus pennsylvanica]
MVAEVVATDGFPSISSDGDSIFWFRFVSRDLILTRSFFFIFHSEWGKMNGGDGGEVAAAPTGPPQPLEWKFSQVFGERTAGEEVQEVDIISAVEFDKSGDHLATGDRGGRVVLFERTDVKECGGNRKDLERMDYPGTRHPEFRYKTEFQSHEPEFDYLKSLEIEEKINKIRWCQTANGAAFLLSTNDKTIKFWKVKEKKVKKICEANVDPLIGATNGSVARSSISSSPNQHIANGGYLDQSHNCSKNDRSFPPAGIPSLRLPVVTSNEISLVARCRRTYAHAHDYHINSISNNSDGETFISADDLRINLWNLEVSNQSFNIIDVKPANMEDLTEVITSAEFHPSHCNMLAYSSSKGSIRLIDLRQSALCDSHSKLFEEQEAPGSRSFFTEIIASISDIKFARDGRYILSRDYMTLKLWDINMDSGPVSTFQVHEYLRPKLCDLYESDSIFDKFECCLSGDGLRVATGSYSNLFRVFGCAASSTEATTLEASKNPMRRQVQTPSRTTTSRSLSSSISRVVKRGSESPGVDANGNSFDFTTKLLHLAWHPTENSIACAAANSFQESEVHAAIAENLSSLFLSVFISSIELSKYDFKGQNAKCNTVPFFFFAILTAILNDPSLVMARRSVENMNVIDKCWRTNPNWRRHRQQLATGSVGYVGKLIENIGQNVTKYTVTNPSDDPLDPKPGTLRYSMTSIKGKVWVTFKRDMNIKLENPLLVSSLSTIDGRGVNVHIANGGCLVLQRVRNIFIACSS